MTIHYVKSWPHLFTAAEAGLKTHDIRRMTERDYKVGDTLVLQEWVQDVETGNGGFYTGRECPMEITYITDKDNHCAFSPMVLPPEYCILSMKKTKIPEKQLGRNWKELGFYNEREYLDWYHDPNWTNPCVS